MADILSVTSLNMYVKSVLESDDRLFDIAVEGELSNFKRYPSGHCYFTLKDEKSAIKAVMFSGYTVNLNFRPENGMKIIARGRVSLYERDGAYQLYVTTMFLSGAGSYRLAFERIKNKLEKEGFFDRKNKKSLPAIPFKIGVATSSAGAAFHDIVSVAKRRFPCVEIILAPCMVQGELAEESIVNAIKKLDSVDDIDLIIIGRGGGSKEDLWVFNSEAVARAAFGCKKPTVSAVGHETDFSILDFVCDVRAATPTAAAELALPDIYSMNLYLNNMEKSIKTKIDFKIDNYKNKLGFIEKSDGFNNVKNAVLYNKSRILQLKNSMNTLVNSKINMLEQAVVSKTDIIETLSPVNNLKRGYALVYKDDLSVKDTDFTPGDTAKIVTFKQEVDCVVKKVIDRKA